MAPRFTMATFFSAVDKVSGPARTMEGNVKKSAEGMKSALSGFKAILGGIAAGLTIGAVVHAVTEFAEKGDEISRTSRMLGISAESLQKLRYAANLAEVPAEALTNAFRKMNVNLGQLHVRQGALYERLKRTNPALAVQLYNTRDSGKAFNILVDAIKDTSNAQERATLAQAAFGRGGQEMIPLIMKGGATIAAMGDEAQRLGLVMSDDAAKAGEKFHESLKRITAAGQGLLYQVLGKILEKIAPVIERFADWATKNDNLVKILPKVLFGVGALIVMMGALDAVMDANPAGAIVVALEALALIAIVVVLNWNKIINALKNAWNWFNKLFNNPWIKVALYALAEPLMVIASFIQTIVDLLSGKGMKSFLDLLGPWKGLTDMIGLTKAGGQIGATPVGTNTHVIQTTTNRSVADINLHYIPAGSTVQKRGNAPGVTLNLGWAAAIR